MSEANSNILDIWKIKETRRERIKQEKLEKDNELVARFNQWLATCQIGDKFPYFMGSHLIGCPVGRLALLAYENGHVTLYQKREKGQSMFSYWAERIANKGRK